MFYYEIDRLQSVDHVAGEKRLNWSIGIGTIDDVRVRVFHPDDLPGRQLDVNGNCTSWIRRIMVFIMIIISVIVD